jgi:hypothetical protein
MVGMLACQLRTFLTIKSGKQPSMKRLDCKAVRLREEFPGATDLAGGFFDLDNLATLVRAALGAGAMRELTLMTVGTLRQAGSRQMIVRAALGGARLGMTSFRIRHENLATRPPASSRRSEL